MGPNPRRTRRRHSLRLWNFDQAQAVVPYVSSIVRSLRERSIQMQAIRNEAIYHISGRGWCDIGYNVIVDKWGNIYEGRAHSLTQPVIGAHAGGFNTGTVGVAMLGTYDAVPSAATQRSVAQIIGWRLGAYGVDPKTPMSYHFAGVPGDGQRYHNVNVTLPRVSGHRAVWLTTCPGNGGYAALPYIRALASSFTYAQRFTKAHAFVAS